MATGSQIKSNISDTRMQISNIVDEISDTVHRRMDWQERIKSNPTGALLAALAAGFLISSFSTTIGRSLLRLGARAAFTALGAYASRQGVNYIKNKIQSR